VLSLSVEAMTKSLSPWLRSDRDLYDIHYGDASYEFPTGTIFNFKVVKPILPNTTMLPPK
jgi:hypothetical protein